MRLIIILCTLFFATIDANTLIFDFNLKSDMSNWIVVNDGVMGGLSKGKITINKEGHALYSGMVTTENNGGFSSIRYNFQPIDVTDKSFVVLKIKGDGKPYQFRIKPNRYNRYSYISYFETTGNWQEIKIPLTRFYPSFRGYRLNRSNFNRDQIEEIGILIGNKKTENFKLIIDSISLE